MPLYGGNNGIILRLEFDFISSKFDLITSLFD